MSITEMIQFIFSFLIDQNSLLKSQITNENLHECI